MERSAVGLSGAAIKGVDFPLHAPPDAYREAVVFLKRDPLSLGALVTTHKIDLYDACREDPVRRNRSGRPFHGRSQLSLQTRRQADLSRQGPNLLRTCARRLSAERHFEKTSAELFSMGAPADSTIALTWRMMQPKRGRDRPSRIVVSDLSAARLEDIGCIHRELNAAIPVDYVLARQARDNDDVLASLKPGSLVVNATGLGKYAPGSPLTEAARFPRRGVARGSPTGATSSSSIRLARATVAMRPSYRRRLNPNFLHGWTRRSAKFSYISDIPSRGPTLKVISDIAQRASKG